MKQNLKLLLIIIIAITVVAASVFAAPIPPLWWPFGVSIIVLAIALGALRVLNKEALQSTGIQKNPLNRFASLLKEEVQNIESILAIKENSTDWMETLKRNQEHFYTQAEVVRPSLVDLLGMKKYIAIITPFALAERQLNRGLSSAMDCYYEEARTALESGREALEQTIQTIQIERVE